MPKKRKPGRKRQIRRSAFLLTLFVALFIALISAGWIFYSHSFKKTIPQQGILAADQQFPITDENAYKSLDLAIVSKYRFEGSVIERVKDLGIVDGSHQSVFSFRVKADNLTEFGLMAEPLTPRPPHGYPVIVLCHGYSTPSVYSTYHNYEDDMVAYSKAGFVVIKPDFRGQGLSLESGKAEGAYYSMAYNTDIMSLLASIRLSTNYDNSNINLWGHSMGAYLALRAAVLSPSIKNLILLSGPVGDFQDMYKTFIPISDKENPLAENIRQATLLRYGTPLTNPDFWQTTSPLAYLSQLRAYVQIHVGSFDRTVPPRFSAELNQELNKSHRPHDYYVYPQGNHGLLNERPDIYTRNLDVLRSNRAFSG